MLNIKDPEIPTEKTDNEMLEEVMYKVRIN
jgi:hypothetical protein